MGMFSAAWTFVRFLVAWIFALLTGLWCCLLCITVGPSRMWVWSARGWARTTLWLVGVRLDIEGLEHLKGPAVFISNHQSLIDVVFLPAILPRTVRFVAKRELLLIPLWGWAFAAGGAVLIDRGRPRAAMQNIRQGLKRLPSGWSVTVFPEGTRPKDGRMRPFKRGACYIAQETRLPIVPIGMDGAREIVPPDGWLVRAGEVRVTVGEPIASTAWSVEDIDAAVAESRTAVERCVQRSVERRSPAARSPVSWAWRCG